MAQIVRIAAGTYRPGINSLGDIVEVQEDNVVLGPAYASFDVTHVPGTKEEVESVIRSVLPQIKRVFKSKAGANEWTDECPEEKEVWNDNGTWRGIEKHPKYQLNLLLTNDVKASLTNPATQKEERDFLLQNGSMSNVKAKPENQTAIAIVTAKAEVEKA